MTIFNHQSSTVDSRRVDLRTQVYPAGASSGFTIIETLVAITVLMIAIAGPLVVATKGLAAAQTSKNQMIATYLAQETMEIAKNTKDNNIASGAAWDELLNECSESSPCDMSPFDDYILCPESQYQGQGCRIYFTPEFGYVNSATGDSTPFYRKFYIEPIGSSEISVNVMVNWREGALPYQVHITNQMLNTTR